MGQRIEIYKDGILINIEDTREIHEEKAERISNYKRWIGKVLAETDWQVTRELERNVPMDTEVKAYRDALLSVLEILELDFEQITTLEEYDAYYGYDDIESLLREGN